MSNKKTDQTLKKCDDLIDRLQELKKALGAVNVASNRKPVNALGVGWSQDPGTGAFHHSTHGVISTVPHPEGGFSIRHGGGEVGRVGDISQAGLKIKKYVSGLRGHDTGMYNRPSPQMPGHPDMDKSDYGPKGGGQYNPADNARRKMNNVGIERFGNQSVKSYTGRATQHKEKTGPAGPVKQYTPEQIAAINEARKLKKAAESKSWTTHNQLPNADEEVQKLAKTNPPEVAENLMANQLAKLMQGKAMLQPNMPFATIPPAQATDEELFGHLVVTEEMEKAAEAQWQGNAFNAFLQEATKPISSRFASEEEELAYWNSIKVSDKPDGNSGY